MEGLDAEYLSHRIQSTRYLFDRLHQFSIPVLCPAGGHAVYVDAMRLLPHLTAHENPGQALAVEIYATSGIRATRIVMNPTHGLARGRHIELVRLALPSRVYSAQHMDYVAESVANVVRRASSIKGLHVVSAPRLLGGFLAKYKPASTIADPDRRQKPEEVLG
jgi:tryptophanase